MSKTEGKETEILLEIGKPTVNDDTKSCLLTLFSLFTRKLGEMLEGLLSCALIISYNMQQNIVCLVQYGSTRLCVKMHKGSVSKVVLVQ